MSSAEAAVTRSCAAFRVPLALLLALLVSAAATNLGLTFAAPAFGASSDSVTVTSTVPSNLQLTDGCSSAIAITVSLGSYAHGQCVFSFGSTNDSSTTLRIDSSAGAFFGSTVFVDRVGGCGVLGNDEIGFKVAAVSASVSAAHGCAVSAATTNGDYIAVPDAPANVCSASALGTTHTCEVAVGVKETGGDATAGTYSDTLLVDVIA